VNSLFAFDQQGSVWCWTGQAESPEPTPKSEIIFERTEAALLVFDETDDSRFGLIGSEAIMV
jgi:hypothetical protein